MILDPQRNLLTTGLAGLIGLLVLTSLALFVMVGRVDVDRIEPVGDTSVAHVSVAVAETGLEPFEEYGEIVRRPVFFSDRRLPVVQMAEAGEEEEDPIEDVEEVEEAPDLKASVAGIIITPEMRMAMINDQTANRTVLLREGMSLEGDQAAWKLDSIQPRGVSFVSVDGRSTGLELEINTRGLTRPTAQRRAAQTTEPEPRPETGAEEPSELDNEARSRAEEIRRRVAERRAELRAEAERRAQQQQDDR